MFSGFDKDGPKFLGELAQNNTKEWFADNKKRFKEKLELPAKEFVGEVELALGNNWKGKIFRIYRDLRFSKDKTPYNTYLRIGFTKEGQASLFFSLESDQLTLGAGTFDFGKEGLVRYREAIVGKEGPKLEALLTKHRDNGLRLEEPELKRVPRGLDSEHQLSSLLRRKSLAIWKDSDIPKWLLTDLAVDGCLEVFEEVRDLRSWLEEVL